MESMRSLNTSLPRSPQKKDSTGPPEQTIQAFRTAALSVANLYKAAAADHQSARESGYQDALEDLLSFLDRENIGLSDGEGWRIRQWATERFDNTLSAYSTHESDDDQVEATNDGKTRSSNSPAAAEREATPKASGVTLPTAVDVAASDSTTINASELADKPSTEEDFTFRSSVPYPQDVDMQSTEPSQTASTTSPHPPPRRPSSAASVRVEVIPRGSPTAHKATPIINRSNSRSSVSTRSSTIGSGSKRKVTFGDIFDLDSLEELNYAHNRGNGGGGATKRSRLA